MVCVLFVISSLSLSTFLALSVFRVFYHIKNRRDKFGTDEIVRFHGDSGIERIRFRGFLLYMEDLIYFFYFNHKNII